MELQKIFAEMDRSTLESFLNIFDKGFRNTIEAHIAGQKVMQPIFCKGDFLWML